jgi:hypothetical protein
MEPGDIVCYKTTGELCVVLLPFEDGTVNVRRPIMTHENGITQSVDTINQFELESVEDHLRREAKEMVLKVQIQNEMQEELDKLQKSKKPLELVN